MVRSIVAALFAVSSLPLVSAHAADTKAGIPALESRAVGWAKLADDFDSPESGPGPVTYDKAHPDLR